MSSWLLFPWIKGRPSCVTARPGRRGILQEKQPLNARDAELLLHFLEGRTDLVDRAADLLGVGLQRARPVVERLGLGFDLREIGWHVLGGLLFHGGETAGEGPSSV